MPAPQTLTVTQELSGQRLDAALAALAPGLSLRQRRRLIADGRVLINHTPASAASKLKSGQILLLLPEPEPAPQGQLPLLLCQTQDFAAINKPAGMHTQALATRPASSLEELLPAILNSSSAILVNRLDQLTSGIVLAALNPDSADLYRKLENQGLVRKTYLTLLTGRLEAELVVKAGLDTARRRKTKVLNAPSPDHLRHTTLIPLKYLPELDATLAQALIRKGARHQIRAHASQAGYPLKGDPLYGPDAPPLYLHHQRLEMPGLGVICQPAWLAWLDPGQE